MKRIHMTAICGTGMGSLAGLLKEKEYEVSGSDANVYPPMSDQLAALGINVKIGYKPENLEPKPDLVIIGNAVPKTNPEVEAVLKQEIPYLSMPEAVEKLFLADRFPLVVAGTHGKTTTCGLLSWLLEETGQSPGFLVGGILQNFEKSYQLGTGDYFVIEGDEYDSAFFDKGPKFLHYHPQMLILNAVEFDHADIYRNLDHLMEAFAKLVALMPPTGLIFACGDNPNTRKLVEKAPCRTILFGLDKKLPLHAENIRFGEKTRFQLFKDGKEAGELTSPLPGRHNVQNLVAVAGLLLELGIPLKEIDQALAGFKGMKRRQEVLAEPNGVTIIDDFAHHPTAVLETLAALRGRYGASRRLWAVFEPRSNTTRRKVFQKDFESAFEPADFVAIAPPYLLEKIPEEERFDPQQLADSLKKKGKNARYFPSVEAIVESIVKEASPGDVICFMSNGGFGGIHQKVIQRLNEI